MTKISYFGKHNSTLGSVVPLAMFEAPTSFYIFQIWLYWLEWVGLFLTSTEYFSPTLSRQIWLMTTENLGTTLSHRPEI